MHLTVNEHDDGDYRILWEVVTERSCCWRFGSQ